MTLITRIVYYHHINQIEPDESLFHLCHSMTIKEIVNKNLVHLVHLMTKLYY